MSNDRSHATFQAGGVVPEGAVRGALEPRRRGRQTNATPAAHPTPLRRWSVAELIARAVPRPPTGDVAH
jgi:hypothetical protein